MRVLITGVGGFVGRHLARLCAERGAEVVGIGRSPAGNAAPPLAKYVRTDLTDSAATRELLARAAPERIFHLAAQASVGSSWSEPRATLEDNVDSTLSLLEAVRLEAPEAAVLVAGSGEQYGLPAPERLPVSELEPPRPQNPYAASKAMADTLAGFYADGHGLAVWRTRAFNHAGPGQSETYVVSSFARQLATAESSGETNAVTVETGNLEPRRDFTDVRDVVEAYWLALDRAPPDAYNVCSGRSVSIADILAGLARHTSLEVRQVTDRTRLRAHEVMDIYGSNEKLTSATGWRPRVPLERTLADTLDWWREQLLEP